MTYKHSILITRFPFESILSGEEWHTITLSQKLLEKGHRITFMGKCAVLSSMLAKDNITSYKVWGGTLPVTKKAAFLFLFLWPLIALNLWFHFIRILFTKKIDRVYMLSLTEKILLTPLTKLLGIHTVWVEHQRIGRWLRLNPLRPFYVLFSHFVDIVGVSPDHVESLQKLKIAKQNVRLITNGIDTSVFSPTVPPLYPSDNKVRIGIVARLYHDKGIHILMQALQIAQKSFSGHLTLDILGEGPEKSPLEALAKELGLTQDVRFLTPYLDVERKDTPRFMKALDVFVLPSTKHDPFGLVVAESMAVGTPVLITQACGISTFLTHKKDAYIVETNNIQALADGLWELAQNPQLRTEIAQHGIRTCHEKFTIERMVGEYEDVMRLG